MQMIITRAATAVKNEAKTDAAGVAAVMKSQIYLVDFFNSFNKILKIHKH